MKMVSTLRLLPSYITVRVLNSFSVYTVSLHFAGEWSSRFLLSLVYFDNRIDFPRKPEAGKETNSSSQKEKQKDHNKSVSKVEKSRHSSGDG